MLDKILIKIAECLRGKKFTISFFLLFFPVAYNINCNVPYIFYNSNIKLYQRMKFGVAVLAGLLFANQAQTLDLNLSGCQLSKIIPSDTFSCPCTGGSGSYDWHYYDIPEGWSFDKDKLVAPKGKFYDNKIYGAKVEVTDKKTKQSVKKSLYFSFQGGKIQQISDHDFDFDVTRIVPNYKPVPKAEPLPTPKITTANDFRDDRVRKLFENVNGVGGGCGLAKIRPYLLGRGGLYKGDSSNPYLNKLPLDVDLDRIIGSGISGDIRTCAVNAVRSRVNCREISEFMNGLLQKLRNKIKVIKDEVESTTQVLVTIKAQIETLQGQLKLAQSSSVDVAALLAQVKSIQESIAQKKATRKSLQDQYYKIDGSINDYQGQISVIVSQKKRLEQDDELIVNKIKLVDAKIADLLAQVQTLKVQKSSLISDREKVSTQIVAAQGKINALKVKIDAAKLSIQDIKAQIQATILSITTAQASLQQFNKSIHSGQTNQQRIADLQAKITIIQRDLTVGQAKLDQLKPIWQDLEDNYEQIAQIGDNNYLGCYKTLYNDHDDDDFREDGEGHMVFNGKDNLSHYIGKVFGNIDASSIVIPNLFDTRQVTGSGAFNSAVTNSAFGASLSNFIENSIRVRLLNIFSKEWVKQYGNPLDKDLFNTGRRFEDDDFTCPCQDTISYGQSVVQTVQPIQNIQTVFSTKTSTQQVLLPVLQPGNAFIQQPIVQQSIVQQPVAQNEIRSGKGKIKSISKNTAKIIDDQGKEFTAYFGGCTRIETINKPLPQAGDDFIWKGTRKLGGKDTDYNIHHCTCA